MWELIAENKRKSFILFLGMGALLLAMGYGIGGALDGPDGALLGLAGAACVWIIMSGVSFFSGGSVLLASAGAQEVGPDFDPRLAHVAEEMKIASNLPAIPKLYVIPDLAPNAFATGTHPKRSAIAVTAGLLDRLDRDELQGVVAHEMSHVLNRDVLFMTFAGVMLCGIQLFLHAFFRSLQYGSSRRYRSSRSEGGSGQAQLVGLLVGLAFAIIGPLLAQLFYFAVSRRREYLADASAARLTRYPEGLASALEKIAYSSLKSEEMSGPVAAMCILDPRELAGGFSTHPPVEERIQVLRRLAHSGEIVVRPPSPPEAAAPAGVSLRRGAGDIIRSLDKFTFLTCACGLKIKVPPEFAAREIACPRCGTVSKL